MRSCFRLRSLDLLVERAIDGLDKENDLRKRASLEIRRTIQEIDMKKAKIATLINITRDSLISKYQYRSGE